MGIAKTDAAKLGWPVLSWSTAAAFGITCLLGVVLALFLRPNLQGSGNQAQLSAVPSSFGVWREVPSPYVPVGLTNNPDRSQAAINTYDQVLMRTYVDDKGHKVMLALAFIAANRQESKIHRPELCYTAQGFTVDTFASHDFNVPLVEGKSVQGKRMKVSSNGRVEVVSYWIRIGSIYSASAFQTRIYILTSGLRHNIPDGILVRVSQIVPPGSSPTEDIYKVQEEFLRELYLASPGAVKRLLAR